jgi:hypothetical protein
MPAFKPLSYRALILVLLSFSVITGYAQKNSIPVYLKHGTIYSSGQKLQALDPFSANNSRNVFEGRLHVLIQFKSIPGIGHKKRLAEKGIELLEYIPENTFLAAVTSKVSALILEQTGVVAVYELRADYKKDPLLLNPNASRERIKVHVSYFPNNNRNKIGTVLRTYGLTAQSSMNGRDVMHLNAEEIRHLAAAPFVAYIEPAANEPEALNDGSRLLLESAGLQNNTPGVGRNLSGTDVVVGLGDDGGISRHPDFKAKGKTINDIYTNTNHATHVAGIMAGPGILNPLFHGQAPKAKVIVNGYNSILYNTPDYYRDYGMTLTNNSYGLGPVNCLNFGNYTYVSKDIDQQLLDYPEVMHVFAAGNDGWRTCDPLALGYRTVYGHYQVAKNVLTVTGTGKDPDYHFYSQGPSKDGRIKPDITAIGFEVLSTVVNPNINIQYGFNYGSSMAAPQVTGILALLLERYRQLHSNANPQGGLLKAIVCNSAKDIGNKGPDYVFGYGWVNAEDAVQTIEKNQYYQQSVVHNEIKRTTIAVPAGTKNLKVMLYWPDQPSSYFTFKNLVNDLDITITDPSGNVVRPYILDTSLTGMLLPATRGEDHFNNTEQVVIENPVAGNYEISVKGYKIPAGSQQYFVVYQLEDAQLQLRHPIGGEKFFAGSNQIITWKEAGLTGNNHTIELSLDGGSTWQLAGVANGPYQFFNYTLPATVSTNARMRITNNNNGQQSVSQQFYILPPVNFTVTDPCKGLARISWSKAGGVDTVTVTRYIGGEMVPVITTTDSSILVPGLSPDTAYWFSVNATLNGIPSERMMAKPVYPVGSNCFDPVFNGDLKLNDLLVGKSGRKLTSTQRSNSEELAFHIKNNDDSASALPFYIRTYINGILFVIDTVTTSIPANILTKVVSKRRLDFSVSGKYQITSVIEKATDPDTSNNSFARFIKIIDNLPVSLPVTETLDGLVDTIYNGTGYFGLEGAEKWDFSSTHISGRLITGGTGGNKFISVDKTIDSTVSNALNTVTATFNLGGYDSTYNILVSAHIIHAVGNQLLNTMVRGSDTSAWISLPRLPGTGNIFTANISKTLRDARQRLRSSFQISFTFLSEKTKQEVFNSLDSISLYLIASDLSLDAVGLVNPQVRRYITDSFEYRIRVRNQTYDPTGAVKVTLQWPDGNKVSATIPSIAKYDTGIVFLKVPATSISSTAATFMAWLEYIGDSYPGNDSMIIFKPSIHTVTDSFPYLQGFEAGPANWTNILGTMLVLTQNPVPEGSPDKAANGNFAWKTNNELIPPPTAGGLMSPSFDLRKLQQPAISFSFSENLRQGIDSAWMDVSYNNGLSWQRLRPLNRINWHNYKQDSLWSSRSKEYWHVATAGGLRNDSIAIFRLSVLRPANIVTYPLWPGGVALDDFHVYDLQQAIVDSSELPASGQIAVSGSQWINILHNGKLVAAIHPGGQDGGNLQWNVVKGNSSVQSIEGRRLLNRNWSMLFSKTFAQPVRIRFYLTDAEAEALRAVAICQSNLLTSAYDLSLLKYDGPVSTINTSVVDNLIGGYTINGPEQFDLVPYDKGYYAEIVTSGNGEYYFAMPADSTQPQLLITALDKSINQVTWMVPAVDTSVLRYDLEIARGADLAQQGIYTLLKTVQANGAVSYQLADTTSIATWYRIKVVYKNGCESYSAVRNAQANSVYTFRVYPNPSPGIYNILPSGILPGTTYWEVTNTIGQVIWRKQVVANGVYDKVVVDLSAAAHSSGVYMLNIRWDGGKQAVRLVKL